VKALSHENACDGGNVVESIDVVVRPGKPTGRGLKTISHGMHLAFEKSFGHGVPNMVNRRSSFKRVSGKFKAANL